MTPNDRGTDPGLASRPQPPPPPGLSVSRPPPLVESGWPLPTLEPGPDDLRSPLWARIAIVVGLGCSLAVLYISTEFAIGQAEGDSPSQAMGYGTAEFFLLVPGVPLLLVGLVRHFRGRLMRAPAVGPVVVLGGVVLWTLFTIAAPGLLLDVLT